MVDKVQKVTVIAWEVWAFKIWGEEHVRHYPVVVPNQAEYRPHLPSTDVSWTYETIDHVFGLQYPEELYTRPELADLYPKADTATDIRCVSVYPAQLGTKMVVCISCSESHLLGFDYNDGLSTTWACTEEDKKKLAHYKAIWDREIKHGVWKDSRRGSMQHPDYEKWMASGDKNWKEVFGEEHPRLKRLATNA